MTNDIKAIKKEVNSFLLINFGIIAFVSIFIFMIASKSNGDVFIVNFAGLFMYIPAFSVIVVLKRISNYKFTPKVDKFLKVFAITTLVRIVISIAEAFLIKSIIISTIIDTIISAYLLCVVLNNDSEFEVLNLSITKNLKKVLFVILIFLIIKIIMIIPDVLFSESNSMNIGSYAGVALVNLIFNFCFGFNLFFGEEFGWRYFLQPRLQKLYGKRFGVIISGFIWGIWHLPLCLTLYSPKTPIYCIIGHLAYCTLSGIFLGYAYMKTKNLWSTILIHLINNNIGIILGGGYESVYTLENLLGGIIINAIFFLPFLFTKEYKVDETLSTDF